MAVQSQKVNNGSTKASIKKLENRIQKHSTALAQETASFEKNFPSAAPGAKRPAGGSQPASEDLSVASVQYEYGKSHITATIQTYNPIATHIVKMEFSLINPSNPLIVDIDVQPKNFPCTDLLAYRPATADHKFLMTELVARIVATAQRRQEVLGLLARYDFNGVQTEGELTSVTVNVSSSCAAVLALAPDYPRSSHALVRRIYRADGVTEVWEEEKFDAVRLKANELRLSLTNLLEFLESSL